MRLLHLIISGLLLAVLIPANGGVVFAQDVFIPAEESRLWIEGSSNINQFECEAKEYSGRADVTNSATSENGTEQYTNDLDIHVEIVTDKFDCGKSRMNRDLKSALKAEEHPKITFKYNYARTVSVPGSTDNTYSVLVNGDLTVAGTTREIEFLANGAYLDGGRMRAQGAKEIKMTDFNIEPPSGLFGLVKADDNLTVHFNLVAIKKNK